VAGVLCHTPFAISFARSVVKGYVKPLAYCFCPGEHFEAKPRSSQGASGPPEIRFAGNTKWPSSAPAVKPLDRHGLIDSLFENRRQETKSQCGISSSSLARWNDRQLTNARKSNKFGQELNGALGCSTVTKPPKSHAAH
jgi:hypothetical protein